MSAEPDPIAGLEPKVAMDAVRAALGGPAAVPVEMEVRLGTLVSQILTAAEPKGCLLELAITGRSPGRVELGPQALTGLGVCGLLEGSRSLFAFAVSLGPGPGRLMQAASDEGRLVDLTLLDAIASEAVEALADQAQAEIQRRCRRQRRASTRRYSPGYCDWALEQQALFAEWGLFSPAGISLTPDFLMLPEKSVSAIVGAGPVGSLGSRLGRPPACRRCPRRPDCPGP